MLQKPKVICEIGVNHNGSLDKALEIISVCAAARCNYVKFQTRTPEEDVPKEVWNDLRTPPWGGDPIPYIEYKRKMELTHADYDAINSHCKKVNISWTTSCWGETALDFMSGYDLPALKLPSAKLTNEKLLRKAAKWAVQRDRELWVSTGMSTASEVSEAYAQIKDEMGDATSRLLVLFNCNSSYPAKTTELNLSLINKWREIYDCRIGYSSHSTTIGSTVAATYLGYSHFEVHVTYDRNAPGSDHFSSLGYVGVFKLMSGIQDLVDAYGSGEKVLWDSELPFKKKLRG